ncbi:MAG: exodeoxyribonuclease V subunit alpha, partial [Actinobacteria bacterium]|nr:exodeoxyribonuclease V subunit alpha [Actinomycetota bacterium]
LDRYWREERQVAADLAVRAEHALHGVDVPLLRAGLDRSRRGRCRLRRSERSATGAAGPRAARHIQRRGGAQCRRRACGTATGPHRRRDRRADAAGHGAGRAGTAPGARTCRPGGHPPHRHRRRRRPGRPAGPEHALHGVDVPLLRAGLDRLFDTDGSDRQRLATAAAVLRPLTVVAGGPGTGKTTTVARILALLDEQAAATGAPPPLVALTAPTGKAAARLEEAVHEEAARLDVDENLRARLLATHASTLHRLLGWQPGNRSRFRHHRGNRLPHDVVVVDETSMVSLSQMAKLVEAVRPDARLVLVGDPQQLASVEAGAVLGDIVGPATDRLQMRPAARDALAAATGHPVDGDSGAAAEAAADDMRAAPAAAGIGDGIVVLQQVHRFGGGIAVLADAIRRGDADATIAALTGEAHDDLAWIPVDLAESGANTLGPVRDAAVDTGTAIAEAARAGEARSALEALGGFRMLCAHRRGPYGVATWSAQVEAWLAAAVPGFAATGAWYVGRPLLVTENDYTLGLYNGDTGVVVAAGAERLTAVFERRGQILEFSPARLSAVETVHVMTIHKSQGSQFDTVAALLPGPDSPILTRELLYTAVTRARLRLLVAGTEAAIRAAVTRPVARSSGLRRWLWGDTTGDGRSSH